MHGKKKLNRLPLTAIQPEGWFYDQLKVQMNGLSGKLYEIWDSVGSYSGWLGGTGESWERAPYYLDGLLPLAYYLQDEKQMEICRRFINWTLESQDETGNFGPLCTKNDYWSRYAMMKVLVQYWEITKDIRVIPFARRYFSYITEEFGKRPPIMWSSARIADLLYCLKWLYEETGDESLLPMAKILQKDALNWSATFADFPYPRPTGYYFLWNRDGHSNRDLDMNYSETHIVNVTMGFKYPALDYYFSGRNELKEIGRKGVEDVSHYHGVISGAINGDEHLSGWQPYQGAELCSVVEYMFSLQSLAEVFGDSFYGDKLERLTFNALPATFTDDMMGHQYLQQANQVLVNKHPRSWYNNDDTSNMFGLEPHFGCCTANMHQGWPKLADSIWYTEGEDTLVSMAFLPSRVSAKLDGADFSVRLKTQYPFRDTLHYEVLKSPMGSATLKIRIPNWCQDMQIACEGAHIMKCNGYALVEKNFHIGDTVDVTLPMEVRFTPCMGGSMAVERGPLVFGLDMKEEWKEYKEVAGIKDWCIYPGSDWNYALLPGTEVEVTENDVTSVPFAKAHPPVSLTLSAKKVRDWNIENGSAAAVPKDPDVAGAAEEKIRLIPFGSTCLRVSQFPYVK